MTPTNLILAQFPGRAFVTLVEAGKAIGGWKDQTSYNLYAAGKFPLKVNKVGRRPMVALTELIRYLEAASGVAPQPSTPASRKMGRPRNSDKMAA